MPYRHLGEDTLHTQIEQDMNSLESIVVSGRLRFQFLAAILAMVLVAVPNHPARAAVTAEKDLNFVFLHGMGATAASMQSLADVIDERAQPRIAAYQQANPGVVVKLNMLLRSYPNNVGAETWAENVATDVKTHFGGKADLILVGHSMGGKAALYGVAHNSGGLGDLTDLVVTINTPVRNLDAYHIVGGGTVTDYIRTSRVISDNGVATSLGSYDSSEDGREVGNDKRWLALISSEPAPLSPEFDFSGLDPYPQDMDDGLVPISAQYAPGADSVYYGEHGHSDFSDQPDVTGYVADKILTYVFGGQIAISAEEGGGTFEHHAGFLPFTYRWSDRLGETIGGSGVFSHTNDSLLRWQSWNDVVGACSPGSRPSRYQTSVTSFPFLTRLTRRSWANPKDPSDCAIEIGSKAAPKTRITVRWKIIEYRPLPDGAKRDHYEIKVVEGTPVVGIIAASWISADSSDVRINASSQAEGPFRWFKAEYRVFSQKPVDRNIIDRLPNRAPGT